MIIPILCWKASHREVEKVPNLTVKGPAIFVLPPPSTSPTLLHSGKLGPDQGEPCRGKQRAAGLGVREGESNEKALQKRARVPHSTQLLTPCGEKRGRKRWKPSGKDLRGR